MGANAVTTFPTYTTGQVLEAADLNITNCGVPTFADSTARDGAFGGTGEKTLAEGQLCYLEDNNIVQYYDGSSWATVGPSAESGLTLISSTTIGSSVSSVTVTGAFSSSYDNYKIIVAGGASSADTNLLMELGATTTGYYQGGNGLSYAGGANTFSNVNGATILVGFTSTNGLVAAFDCLSPNLADQTIILGSSVLTITLGSFLAYGGFVNNTTQYTAFTLKPATGTLTGGIIKVYGYKN